MRREAMAELEGGGLETLTFIALKHLFRKRADRMAFSSNVWRRKPDAEIDILVRDCSGAEIAWIGCCKRDPAGHAPKADIADLERLLEDGGIGAFGEVRGFKKKRMISVSPSFTEKVKDGLALKVADAMEETDMTVDWYTLDIPDMLAGRGPRPLLLPEPKKDIKKDPVRSDDHPPEPGAKGPEDNLPPETEFKPILKAWNGRSVLPRWKSLKRKMTTERISGCDLF